MRARLIDIEGIDQSGKHTQTLMLANRLRKKGYKTRIISFPIYNSSSGREIKQYLTNKKSNMPVQAVHMLYSLNRWENLPTVKKAMSMNDIVILDRYAPSNMAYGIAKGLDPNWLESLDKGLPVPNNIIVLRIPVDSSFERKTEHRDKHEKNRVFLKKVAEAYENLARSKHWTLINGNMSSQEVHNAIWRKILPKISPTNRLR